MVGEERDIPLIRKPLQPIRFDAVPLVKYRLKVGDPHSGDRIWNASVAVSTAIMNILSPCRSIGIPFVAHNAQRKLLIARSSPQKDQTADRNFQFAGLAPLLLPGYAWAEDIVSEAQSQVQSLDVPSSLPESLPSAEQVRPFHACYLSGSCADCLLQK